MSQVRSAAGVLVFTYIAARTFWWLSDQSWRLLDDVWFEGLLKTVVWVIPSVVVLIAIRRLTLHEALRELGLEASALRGYGFGLLATVPMMLALPFGSVHMVDPAVFAGTVLFGPLAEEVLFRGFLFRQLLTRARWKLGWAIAVSAIAFALAHFRDVDFAIAGQLIRLSLGVSHAMERSADRHRRDDCGVCAGRCVVRMDRLPLQQCVARNRAARGSESLVDHRAGRGSIGWVLTRSRGNRPGPVAGIGAPADLQPGAAKIRNGVLKKRTGTPSSAGPMQMPNR